MKERNSVTLSKYFLGCAIPLHVDPYSGCSAGCIYCFANSRSVFDPRREKTKTRNVEPARHLTARLDRLLHGEGTVNEREAVARGIAIRMGVMSDPFQAREADYQSGLAVLEWTARHGYPLTLSTKFPTRLLEPPYLPLATRKGCHLQVSFSTFDDDEAARLEPRAPRPTERLEAIAQLARAGAWITVRLCPLIPWIRSGNDPEFSVGLIAGAGARHLVCEHLVLNDGQQDDLSAALNLDIRRLFKGAFRIGHSATLRVERRIGNLMAFRDATMAAGLTFGCGDYDMKLFNQSLSCCGVDLALGRRAVSPALSMRIGEEIRRKGYAAFEDVEHDWAPTGRIPLNEGPLRRMDKTCRGTDLRGSWWMHEGGYGIKLVGDRYELDTDVRYIDRLTSRLTTLSQRA